MKEFFALTRAGDYGEAARFLETPPGANGPELARRLKAVLDRHAWVDFDVISGEALGDPTDGLPSGVDEIGRIPSRLGKAEPVRIVRRQTKTGPRWLFSRSTLARVDTWYKDLEGRWFLDNLPPALLRPGPRELLWWQWLAIPILFMAAWAVGRLFGWVTNLVLGRFAARTSASWDDKLLVRLRRPIRTLWALVAVYMAIFWLALYAPAELFLTKALRAAIVLTVFWALLRSVDVVADYLVNHWDKAKDVQSFRAVVPVASSVAKVFVIAMSLVVVLSEFGYPAASLITGLGVGGVALALAAQKTVENLFGSVSIGIDKPFRVGDFVKVDDFLGTVELVGLRSTRFRTLDRTIITIPNGRLADMRVESFTARDRIRLALKVGLVYGTTAAQMRTVLSGIESVLREHPKTWPDSMTVYFEALGESALTIDVMAWFMTADSNEFQVIRQDILLRFMEIVEEAGTAFAFPTRTVHLKPGETLDRRPEAPPPPRAPPPSDRATD